MNPKNKFIYYVSYIGGHDAESFNYGFSVVSLPRRIEGLDGIELLYRTLKKNDDNSWDGIVISFHEITPAS